MKTTPYFENDVKHRRAFLKEEWIVETIAGPEHTEIQSDGRKRFWRFIPELDKFLRVITLEDGETVLNAFPDRSFKPQKEQ
jgi:hypothetical protein